MSSRISCDCLRHLKFYITTSCDCLFLFQKDGGRLLMTFIWNTYCLVDIGRDTSWRSWLSPIVLCGQATLQRHIVTTQAWNGDVTRVTSVTSCFNVTLTTDRHSTVYLIVMTARPTSHSDNPGTPCIDVFTSRHIMSRHVTSHHTATSDVPCSDDVVWGWAT